VYICRTFDLAEIWAVLDIAEIKRAVFEDGMDNITDFTPNVLEEVWLRVWHDDRRIGLFRFHKASSVCLQVHAHILPQFRKQYSLQSARLALSWVVEHISDLQKIIAYCPEKYQNVYAFLKKFGFKDEGFNRESWKVGGKIYGQYLMGLARSEFTKILEAEHG